MTCTHFYHLLHYTIPLPSLHSLLPLPPSHFLLPLPPSHSLPPEYDYDDLRAEAAIHAKLRAEAFQKAAEARSRNEGQVAWHYAQQVNLMVM